MKRSKRPSASSAPPEPVFFADRNLGRQFVEVLREAGLGVEAHDDHFSITTSDEHWLREVTQRGWVALTHDANIRYTSRATAVVFETGTRLLVLKGGAPARDLATNFVLTIAIIKRFLARHRGPFIAKVYRHPHDPTLRGRIEMWLQPGGR